MSINRLDASDRFFPKKLPRAEGSSARDDTATNRILKEIIELMRSNREVNRNEIGLLYFRKKRYHEILRATFGLNSDRLFAYSPPRARRDDRAGVANAWPVKPRKRNYLSEPYCNLHLPDENINGYCSIDWSALGKIASFYENNIYIYDSLERTTSIIRNSNIKCDCLKFNDVGDVLAVPLKDNGIILYYILKGQKKMYRTLRKHNTVTCIEWYSGKIIILGFTAIIQIIDITTGIIYAMNCSLKSSIVRMKKSCNGKYLAVQSDLEISVYVLDNLKHFDVNFVINVPCVHCIQVPNKVTFAWHPWKESLLVWGQNNKLALWDILTDCETNKFPEKASYVLNAEVSVEALTFNPLSAELLVSVYVRSLEHTIILVLSDFNTLTDCTVWHAGRVKYLLWNRDCDKLLSTDTHCSLCLWNFFGSEVVRREKKKTSFKSFDTLQNFSCIR